MDVREVADWPIDLIKYWVAYCELASEMREKANVKRRKV